MTRQRPNYGQYLLWWCIVWFPITVLTQMPECYERSRSLAPWLHTSVPGELIGFAFSRLLAELPFGLLWGSLSWLLLWGALGMLGKFVRQSSLQYHDRSALGIVLCVVVLLATLQTIALGVPLARWNTGAANFSLATDDAPTLTITDRSIGIESDGVLLVFPLACLVAGFAMVRRHRTWETLS